MCAERDDSFRYFRAIEETFIRLRGAPFLLSPSDWRVVKGWFDEGIPLDVVGEALRDVFERRVERGAVGPVQGLRYCAAAVAAAWKERRELGSVATGADGYRVPIAIRLERLADALPEELPSRARWVERVRASAGDASEVEIALAELDRRLVGTVLASLSEAELAELESEASAALESLGARIGGEQRVALHRRFVRDAARRRFALPVLSLFSPEAREPRRSGPSEES